MGSARAGSNPAGIEFLLFMILKNSMIELFSFINLMKSRSSVSRSSVKSRGRTKSVAGKKTKTVQRKKKSSSSLNSKKWKVGMCVAPPGMPEYYVLEKKVGDSWKAVHYPRRYFDMIPCSVEKVWVIRDCKKKKGTSSSIGK